MEINLLTDRLN